MADITSRRTIDPVGEEPDSYPFKYKDMDDGTYAEIVAASIIDSGGVQTAYSYTVAAHTVVNVNGNTNIIAANTSRKYLLVINDSDTVIYLTLGGDAAVNSGIRLNANGGNYEMSLQQGSVFTGLINANHGGGAADKLLLILEGT